MRIFVTGGTGFIGKHVIKKLMEDGNEVELLKCNLGETEKLSEQLKMFGPEAVIHLAWEGIPDYGVETSARNLDYGLNLLKAVAETNCKVLISTGSCWEYGDVAGEVSEDLRTSPNNAFATAKTAFQMAARSWAMENKIKFFWLRLFFVYGPGQKNSSLVPYVISSVQNGVPPELKNIDGGNDFVYAGDVANAVTKILKKYPKLESAIYNVGSGRLTGVAEVVDIVNKYFGLPQCAMVKKIKPAGFYADISKIQKDIDWKPETTIEDGIKKMIN